MCLLTFHLIRLVTDEKVPSAQMLSEMLIVAEKVIRCIGTISGHVGCASMLTSNALRRLALQKPHEYASLDLLV